MYEKLTKISKLCYTFTYEINAWVRGQIFNYLCSDI